MSTRHWKLVRLWGEPMARNASRTTTMFLLLDLTSANGAAVIMTRGSGFLWLSAKNE